MGETHLLFVLVDVEVELAEGAERVELVGVQAGLLHQIGVHILVTDAGHLTDVSIVPESNKQAI